MLKPSLLALTAVLALAACGSDPYAGREDRMAERTYQTMRLADLHRSAITDPLRPADDRTTNVFDEAIRGRTDQFVYRFRKPG